MTLLLNCELVRTQKLCLVSALNRRLSLDEKSSKDFPKKFQECGRRTWSRSPKQNHISDLTSYRNRDVYSVTSSLPELNSLALLGKYILS